MKQFVKHCLTLLADTVLRLRGFRFPYYIHPRHRIDLLLFGNEQDVSRLMKRKLAPGMCVLDVGANIGLISRICAARVGSTGRVIAFEPDPYTRGFLEHNVSRFRNVTVSPIALSNENTKAKLHIHPHSGTSNSLVDFEASTEAVEVDCLTIDSFLEANPGMVPGCIKIDVEGAEPKVLAGMRMTVKRVPNLFVVIEFCPENLANGGYRPRDYHALLESMELAVEIIHKNGTTSPVSGFDDLMAKLGKQVYCNLLCYRRN
jgi:FkbM family methyltransferase